VKLSKTEMSKHLLGNKYLSLYPYPILKSMEEAERLVKYCIREEKCASNN